MKKTIVVLMMLMLCLSGCQAVPTFETLGNIEIPNLTPSARTVCLQLPEDAAVHTAAGEQGRIYFCDGYEIMVETVSAGNVDATLRSLTGFGRDDLTILQTKTGEITSYSCVWTSAGEAGDQISRTAILDDGNYHYCLTVTAPAQEAGSLQSVWQALFQSFSLG